MTNLINRRSVLKGLAGGLAVATTITAGIALKTAPPPFDAAAYIDKAIANGERPHILSMNGRELGGFGFNPDDVEGGWGPNGENYHAYADELSKRNMIDAWEQKATVDKETGAITYSGRYWRVGTVS